MLAMVTSVAPLLCSLLAAPTSELRPSSAEAKWTWTTPETLFLDAVGHSGETGITVNEFE